MLDQSRVYPVGKLHARQIGALPGHAPANLQSVDQRDDDLVTSDWVRLSHLDQAAAGRQIVEPD